MLAAVFFVVPLAIAVGALTVKYPGAGGLYLWTRKDFGPWHGFLGFWVYWVGIAFWFPSAAMFYMSAALYTMGPRFAHLGQDRVWLVGISLVAIWLALIANMVGMRIGKWAENIAGASAWVLVGTSSQSSPRSSMQSADPPPRSMSPRVGIGTPSTFGPPSPTP